ISPPLVGSAAGILNPLRLVSTSASCPGDAGLWMCMATGTPVRSVNPSAEPYPTDRLRMVVSVSNTIPGPTILPEPVLLVTTGTSLLGLKPTAASVPGGERANRIWAACADRVAATSKTNNLFITAFLLYFGCSFLWWELALFIAQKSWSSKSLNRNQRNRRTICPNNARSPLLSRIYG